MLTEAAVTAAAETTPKAPTGQDQPLEPAAVAEPVVPLAEAEHPVAQDGGWVSTAKSIGSSVGGGLLATGKAIAAIGAAGAAGTSKALTERRLRKLSRQQQAILDAAAAAEKAKEEGAEVSETNPERRRSWTETLKEV
eukprot:g1175.t1